MPDDICRCASRAGSSIGLVEMVSCRFKCAGRMLPEGCLVVNANSNYLSALHRRKKRNTITSFQLIIPGLIINTHRDQHRILHLFQFRKFLEQRAQQIRNRAPFRKINRRISATGQVFKIRIKMDGDAHRVNADYSPPFLYIFGCNTPTNGRLRYFSAKSSP